jgi:hypothetical protein
VVDVTVEVSVDVAMVVLVANTMCSLPWSVFVPDALEVDMSVSSSVVEAQPLRGMTFPAGVVMVPPLVWRQLPMSVSELISSDSPVVSRPSSGHVVVKAHACGGSTR